MDLNNIPVIKVIVNDEETGIEQISFVEEPAMMEEWKLFNENKKQNFSISEEEMIIYYPVIVANTPIYRKIYRNTPFEHFVLFTKEEIKTMRNRFFKNNNHHSFNENHGPVKINGAYIVESWIKMDENDKSVNMGYNVPVDSWFVGIKIEDKDYWENKVKTGKFTGLSMEAFYDLDIDEDIILENYTKALLNMNLSDDTLKVVLKDILKNFEKL